MNHHHQAQPFVFVLILLNPHFARRRRQFAIFITIRTQWVAKMVLFSVVCLWMCLFVYAITIES